MNYEDFDEFFLKLYKPIRLLGKGAFGTVWLCKNAESEVAVKVIQRNKSSNAHNESAVTEAHLMEKLDHENIIKFICLRETEKFICYEVEYLPGGSLKDKLISKFTDSEAATVMRALFSAVSYIHSKEIVHRDIKPENILFASSDLNSLKLVDFGLSRKLTTDYTLDDHCGTILFMAPEQAENKNYSEAVDIWSCSIILYILITGKHPLYTPGDNQITYFHKLKNPVWQFPDDFPPLAKDLFEHLVDPLPFNRYTAQNALHHPWITRKLDSDIPVTYAEQFRVFQTSVKMRNILSALFFITAVNHFSGTVYGPYKHHISNLNRRSELIINLTTSTTDESLECTSILSSKSESSDKHDDAWVTAIEKIHEAEMLMNEQLLKKGYNTLTVPKSARKIRSYGSLYKESLKKDTSSLASSKKISNTPTARLSSTLSPRATPILSPRGTPISSPRGTISKFSSYAKNRLNQD